MCKRLKERGFEIVDSGYSSYKNFDSELMEHIRKTANSGAKTTREEGLWMARSFQVMLRGGEDAYSGEKESQFDNMTREDAPPRAIRVLARKLK